MRAEPSEQLRLLDLSAVDTALAQLAHRRATLPEHAELDRLVAALGALDDEQARAQAGVADLDRDIARLERDIDQVRERATRDQRRMDEGGTPKELESLQHELGTLARRQTELEDAELELMERREEAQAGSDTVGVRLAETRDAEAAARQRRDAALAGITADEQRRQGERRELVTSLPADLVALYEKIREQTGGVGAAAVRARRCESCRLELSGSDLARVRSAAPDEVVRCEDCRAILVRTPESGL